MYAEDYTLSSAIALDLVMAQLCKEHGWDAHVSHAVKKRNRLMNNPDELAEELKYVPFETVKQHLEPEVSDWLDFDKVEQLWISDLVTIEHQPADSFQAYGY